MRLSLSARIAERFYAKREASITLVELCDIACSNGYQALCMRASLVGIHTPVEEVRQAARLVAARGLAVSMVTGDFAIPENSPEGPAALRHIRPYLDLADALGCDLLRIALRDDADIRWAQRAADEARERGIRLAHQCHNKSLFEQISPSLAVLQRIGRTNFGITFEPANLELCGEPYGRDTIARLAPYLFNVYLQNQRVHAAGDTEMLTWCRGRVRFDQIPIHQPGGIDFEDVFAGLQDVGYDGVVTVHDASLGYPRDDAAASARFLRSIAAFGVDCGPAAVARAGALADRPGG